MERQWATKRPVEKWHCCRAQDTSSDSQKDGSSANKCVKHVLSKGGPKIDIRLVNCNPRQWKVLYRHLQGRNPFWAGTFLPPTNDIFLLWSFWLMASMCFCMFDGAFAQCSGLSFWRFRTWTVISCVCWCLFPWISPHEAMRDSVPNADWKQALILCQPRPKRKSDLTVKKHVFLYDLSWSQVWICRLACPAWHQKPGIFLEWASGGRIPTLKESQTFDILSWIFELSNFVSSAVFHVRPNGELVHPEVSIHCCNVRAAPRSAWAQIRHFRREGWMVGIAKVGCWVRWPLALDLLQVPTEKVCGAEVWWAS